MLFQLFTEDINRPVITGILDRYFDGYTLLPATGRWHGIPEPSLVAEIETDNPASVHAAASEIKTANHQQAVLVESIPATATLT